MHSDALYHILVWNLAAILFKHMLQHCLLLIRLLDSFPAISLFVFNVYKFAIQFSICLFVSLPLVALILLIQQKLDRTVQITVRAFLVQSEILVEVILIRI